MQMNADYGYMSAVYYNGFGIHTNITHLSVNRSYLSLLSVKHSDRYTTPECKSPAFNNVFPQIVTGAFLYSTAEGIQVYDAEPSGLFFITCLEKHWHFK